MQCKFKTNCFPVHTIYHLVHTICYPPVHAIRFILFANVPPRSRVHGFILSLPVHTICYPQFILFAIPLIVSPASGSLEIERNGSKKFIKIFVITPKSRGSPEPAEVMLLSTNYQLDTKIVAARKHRTLHLPSWSLSVSGGGIEV